MALGKRSRVLGDRLECLWRGGLVHSAIERRRPQVLTHAFAQPRDLCRRNHPVSEREQNHRDPVVVRRQDHFAVPGGPELDVGNRGGLVPGAEIFQHPWEIVVTAEREDVSQLVRERGTPGRDDGKPAAEADAHQRGLAIGRQRRFVGQPYPGVLDRVRDRWRDLEPRELRDVWRDDRDVARGELLRQPHQTRFVDARGMKAGCQERRAPV